MGEAGVREDELALYTDGACKGNQNVTLQKCPAGWGLVIVGGGGDSGCHLNASGRCVAELFGPVVLDASSPFFLGAELGSNNTGELSAICEALLWLLDHENSSRSAAIYYDSEYAAKITTGEYRAAKNKTLAAEAQSLLRCVRQKRAVRFEHVKGHSKDKWNDAADRCANRGSSGEICSIGRYAGASSMCASSSQPPSKRARIDA
jgi:ribonuclease HI